MFVILVYDVKTKRNNKILKTCRKYLRHVQKSVFEGNLTEAKLKRLKNELKKISNEKEDSIIIYRKCWGRMKKTAIFYEEIDIRFVL